ncbi:MAG: hypothetical protein IT455_19525 [Planctomycetes bacterium]|nr:hypothetical protein [Planctomycetota bacterium]
MFDRLIRLARAKRALRDERFEAALQLAGDPVVALDRRAESIRLRAGQQIVGRARRRLGQGDLAAAAADLDTLRRFGASGVEELAGEVAAAAAAAAAASQQQQRARDEVGHRLDAGELDAAERVLASAGPQWSAADRRGLLSRLTEQRQRGAELAAAAQLDLDRGDLELASERLATAAALDRDGKELAELGRRIRAAAAAALAPSCRQLLQAGDLPGALRRVGRVAGRLPVATAADALQGLHEELVAAVVTTFTRCQSLDVARGVAAAVVEAGLVLPAAVAQLSQAVLQLPDRPGALARADDFLALAAASKALGAAGLREIAERHAAAANAAELRLANARQLILAGDLDAARALLLELALTAPLDEAVRRELDLVERGLGELDQRLVTAREALRAGRLGLACSTALGLGGSRRVADEAQQVVAEARARMALVDRGLDEVRVALYGRGAATVDGVAHCLKRLQELAKVQVDHAELPAVIQAVALELEQLAELDAARAAAAQHQLPLALAALQRVLAHRAGLLAPDRLDARFCDRADELARGIEAALAAGRLDEVAAAADGFATFAAVRADYRERAAGWQRGVATRREAALAAVAAARQSLAAKDLAEAERQLDVAQNLARDAAEVRHLASELRRVRQQADVLDRVADLTAEKDFLGAGKKLAAMPSAPPFLRTRIYDMKQDLARAQGLEGAFLLRVDEGGEHLVLRGDTVTIGNVRQARADVPVLAQLAGLHASLRRSMSFHGGMQDSIVAEEGEVVVRGSKVSRHALVPGDRVALGAAFGFVYQRPSRRSLTAALTLQSGFRVASTDRLLLMKDRGRDGRILLGPAGEVHVRVARARGEVEVFAANSGQMRVFCEAGGTIDGAPFRGEHPVAAGQIVEANGIAFVLMPWQRQLPS